MEYSLPNIAPIAKSTIINIQSMFILEKSIERLGIENAEVELVETEEFTFGTEIVLEDFAGVFGISSKMFILYCM